MISVDRAIGVGVGLGVTLLSISGLMCINSTGVCSSDKTNSCIGGKKCAKVNMNLGLSSLCAAGGLIVYKNTF